MNKHTERIDRYLLDEMNPQEKAAFEQELALDAELKKEFELQQDLSRQLYRMGLKAEIGRTMKHIRQLRNLGFTSLIIVLTGALVLGIYYFRGVNENITLERNTPPAAVSAPIVPVFEAEIDTRKDTVLECPGGMFVAIPAGAFGESAKPVRLEVQEALDELSILKSGLTTTSNGELLQTAGMFSIRAYSGESELEWKKELSVLIPADSLNRNMMLFEGALKEDGTVNWVNPQRVFDELPAVDIRTLDFYPPTFLPTLQRLGEDIGDKAYTDSLYYSFSGYTGQRDEEASTTEVLLSAGSEKKSDATDTFWKAPPTGNAPSAPLSDSTVPAAETRDYRNMEIDPARIKAIWNESFNGTLLATRAFEERLRYIHTTCEPRYLDIYVNNLNKPLYRIDSLCMISGFEAGGQKFREFYERKEGGVRVGAALEAELREKYRQKQEVWKEASRATWKNHYRELDSLEEQARLKNEKFRAAEALREKQVFGEEYCRNLVNAYAQIGVKRECPMRIAANPGKTAYVFPVSRPGWKNLDQYVFASTQNRESMRYTDPVSGKQAVLTYEPVSFRVTEEASFERLFLYLLPDSLSSFQRVERRDGQWAEKLNASLNYRFVALAYRGDSLYACTLDKLEPGTYTLDWQLSSDESIKAFLQTLPGRSEASMNDELEYRRFQVVENKRIRKLRNREAWIREVASGIFPCMPVAAPAPPNIQRDPFGAFGN